MIKKLFFSIIVCIFMICVCYADNRQQAIDNLQKQGYSIVQFNDSYTNIVVSKNNKYGVFDTNSLNLIPVAYDNIEILQNIYIVTLGNLKGAYTNFGNGRTYTLTVPVNYNEILYVEKSDTCFIIVNKNNKKEVYIVSNYGNNINKLPTAFNEIKIQDYNIAVKQNNKWGVYRDLTIIVPIDYDNVQTAGSGVIVTLNGKKGVYHKNRMIIPAKYDEIIYAKNNNNQIETYIVKQNNKYGVLGYKYLYIDEIPKVKQLVPVDFDEITAIYRGFITKNNNKYGLYHIAKGKISNTIYDKIDSPDTRTVNCWKNGNINKFDFEEMKSLEEIAEQNTVKILFYPIYKIFEGLP